MIAGALRFALFPVEKKESRFEGIPPINPISSFLPNVEEILSYTIWAIVYLGIILLVIIIVASAISSRRKFKKDFPPETW